MQRPLHGALLLALGSFLTWLVTIHTDGILDNYGQGLDGTSAVDKDLDDEYALLQLGRTYNGEAGHVNSAGKKFFADPVGKIGGSLGAESQSPRDIVWIDAFGRSGSSLVLDLVANSYDNEEDVFALFEPCHKGDRTSPELEAEGCAGMLKRIAVCNFTEIEHLWGWSNAHTTNQNKPYSKETATELCMRSQMVAIKTITFHHRLNATTVGYLYTVPYLHIITVIRDPRASYASMQELQRGFHGSFGANGVDTMFEMCNAYAANALIQHERLLHLQYETLVEQPMNTTQSMQLFLGRPFTQKQAQFVHENFDSDCEGAGEYSTCRSNSTAMMNKYKHELSNNEFAAFMAHSSCRMTCTIYGYPCWYFRPFSDSPFSGLIFAAIVVAVLGAVTAVYCCCKGFHK
jgi:hypothetical protein